MDPVLKRVLGVVPKRPLLCLAGLLVWIYVGRLICPSDPDTALPARRIAAAYSAAWQVGVALWAVAFAALLAWEIVAARSDKAAGVKRERIGRHLHFMLQASAELARKVNTPEFPEAADRFFDLLFYCVPQVLSGSPQLRRMAFLVPDTSASGAPTHLRIGRCCSAFAAEHVASLRLPLWGSTAGRAFRTKTSVIGTRGDPDWYDAPDESSSDYGSVLCSPVVLGDEAIGVLSIDQSAADSFSDDDKDYLELLARLVALVSALLAPRPAARVVAGHGISS